MLSLTWWSLRERLRHGSSFAGDANTSVHNILCGKILRLASYLNNYLRTGRMRSCAASTSAKHVLSRKKCITKFRTIACRLSKKK